MHPLGWLSETESKQCFGEKQTWKVINNATWFILLRSIMLQVGRWYKQVCEFLLSLMTQEYVKNIRWVENFDTQGLPSIGWFFTAYWAIKET